MRSGLPPAVGILGYGVDGQAVADWLSAQPEVEKVVVFDDKIDSGKLKMESGKLTKGETLNDADLLFRSPGFPLTHRLILDAKEKRIPVTSSTIEVLTHFPGITVGITGSNGKTTCTALIEAMFRAEFGDDRVERGGNDGVPRLDLIPIRKYSSDLVESNTHANTLNDKILVLELSSFQLIDCPVSPNVAVVLNISPNHLDWHASMEEYVEAKRQITLHQMSGMQDVAVLNENDPVVRTFADGIESDVYWSGNCTLPTDNLRFKSHPDTIRAAVTAARALKVSEANIKHVLETFPGVPHRLEFVRELDKISYYNDSSCTTPESAIVACSVFPKESLILLLGGRDKGMDFSKLYEVIQEKKVRVVPYGEKAEDFHKNIPESYHLKPKTSFEEVVAATRSLAKPGDNVVLSPACASFDMFQNSKERGKRFTEIVHSLR